MSFDASFDSGALSKSPHAEAHGVDLPENAQARQVVPPSFPETRPEAGAGACRLRLRVGPQPLWRMPARPTPLGAILGLQINRSETEHLSLIALQQGWHPLQWH